VLQEIENLKKKVEEYKLLAARKMREAKILEQKLATNTKATSALTSPPKTISAVSSEQMTRSEADLFEFFQLQQLFEVRIFLRNMF
jgi:predicted SPOUT superfamily RNA methylase MTH1